MDIVFCKNCHNDIPKESWNLHEASCERHRYYCETCRKVFLKNEYDKHTQEYHRMISCECGVEIEIRKLEEHKEKYCQERLVTCVYCEYSVSFRELSEHENDCGSRTEPCESCGKRVMLRYYSTHVCDAEDPTEQSPTGELIVCPYCLSPTQDYVLLQEHIFNDHPETVI